MKKFASLLMAVLMVCTMLTAMAIPAFATGEFDFSNYCLCGDINGDDYGMTPSSTPKWNEPGEYVFSKDGKLTATFEKDSNIQLKTKDGKWWYAFEFVTDGTPTKLYEQSLTYREKMFVPSGKTVTFTITKDATGALVLGYTENTTVLSNGYYLVGILGDKTCWDAASLTSDMKLEANAVNPGEYTLDWTFCHGDRIKVVKVEDGEIVQWFNNGIKAYKIGESEEGNGTVYFRHEGNPEWAYFFFTVIPDDVGIASALSESNLWIILVVAVIAVAGVAALVIVKKKPALAGGENTDEE